ncbi:hypothetical protein GALL_415420 [mine drainage metagenome]|uniref:Uncharacterized protein n=1 Tax=mine drainage metagenome TaxID=410659 RepID=A0A1J5Q0H4_9ZZZZ
MANVAGQMRAVEGVEVQILHAFTDQGIAKLGADRGREQLFTAVADGMGKGLVEPLRDGGAAAGGELLDAVPVGDR